MAENRRERDKRFYFSRGQLVLLGSAFTLASLVIFLLGIFVGKRIEERRVAKPEEPLIRIPVKPSGQDTSGASAGQSKEEITFYDTLAKSARAELPPESKLNEVKQPEKEAQPGTKEPPPRTKETPPPARPKAETKPAEKARVAAPKSSPAPVAQAAGGGESGQAWYVQVNALPDENSAKIWVDRLRKKGYKAYLSEARVNGKVWYRVRVGQYGSREEAEKMEGTLKTKEKLSNAFATHR
jgi:cell division septation protein DedD